MSSTAPRPTEPAKLKRSLGLWLLTLYGLGTTVGAGIYVLIGAVAGAAGPLAPLAFLLAAGLASFSVLSFCELTSRLPRSAGEALYVHTATGRRGLALLVGLLVTLAGIVSSATLSRGFVGYLGEFVAVPPDPTIAVLIILLGAIALWGITESVGLAALATLIELGGLLLIIAAGWERLPGPGAIAENLAPPLDWALWPGLLGGSVLAFYAFIGFEDMVNVAEEVKDPRRTLPRAMVLTLILTALVYLTLVLIAINTLPAAELAGSAAPLALLFEVTTGWSSRYISAIALVAIVNGALIQIIMAARVLYGLGSQGWLPAWFAVVNPRTRTPARATVLATLAVLVFALWLPLVTLAKVTSIVTLTIFAAVNLALIIIKRRDPRSEAKVTYPLWVPIAGFLASSAFVVIALVPLVFSLR